MIARHKLILAALALVLSTIALLVSRSHPVYAQTKETCEWTYIQDAGLPNLGEDGKVDLKDKSWKAMSDGGWHLKASVPLQALGTVAYVFERCK